MDRCRTSVGTGNDPAEIVTPTRRFSLLEITSGLLDDSREADDRASERRLRDLRGRVKAARAAVSRTPGALEVLRQDWVKAAQFYVRVGITEWILCHGVPPSGSLSELDSRSELNSPFTDASDGPLSPEGSVSAL